MCNLRRITSALPVKINTLKAIHGMNRLILFTGYISPSTGTSGWGGTAFLRITVFLSVELTGGPLGGVPLAVAVLVCDPLSSSGWVTISVWLPVVVAAGCQCRAAQGDGPQLIIRD
jgi:hypothetical protein